MAYRTEREMRAEAEENARREAEDFARLEEEAAAAAAAEAAQLAEEAAEGTEEDCSMARKSTVEETSPPIDKLQLAAQRFRIHLRNKYFFLFELFGKLSEHIFTMLAL